MTRVGDHARVLDNLPGAVMDLKDGVGGLTSQQTVGDHIVFIGQSTDGPSLEPVSIDSVDTAEEIFGSYYNRDGTRNGANLTWAAKRAIDMGADNIALMRLGGETGTGEIPLDGYYETKTRESREFFGEALGNQRTKIDLLNEDIIEGHIDSIESENRKNYKADNIRVSVEGHSLSGTEFVVDNDNMIVTIREGVVNSLASVSVSYDIIEIQYGNSGYLPSYDNEEFKVASYEYGEAEAGSEGEIFVIPDPHAKFLNSVHVQNSSGNVIKEYNVLSYGSTDGSDLKEDDVYVSSYNNETTEIKFETSPLEEPEPGEDSNVLILEYLFAPTGSNLESAVSSSKASNRQFDTRHQDIVLNSELVFKSYLDTDGSWKVQYLQKTNSFDGTADENRDTYTIDYESGRITVFEQVDTEAGEEILVAYRYNDNEIRPREVSGLYTLGDSMVLTLENQIKGSRDDNFPVTLLADGSSVPQNAYAVDTPNDGPSVVTLFPGNVNLGDQIEVVYYWEEEVRKTPVIKLEGYYPGSVYNDTLVTIQDSFFSQRSTIDFDVRSDIFDSEGNLKDKEDRVEDYIELEHKEELDGGIHVYKFPNRINIGSIEKPMLVPFDTLSYNIEDLYLYKNNGSGELVDIDDYGVEFEVNFTEGTIRCEIEEDIGLMTPKFTFFTTSENISFVRDETLQAVSSTERRFANRDLLKEIQGLGAEPLDLYIVRDGGNVVDLEPNDYDINWATGVVHLDPVRALGSRDRLICRRYAYHNISGKILTIRKPREKTSSEENRDIVIDIDRDIQTVGHLVEVINEHSRNNVIKAKIDNDVYSMNIMSIRTPEVKIIGNIFGDNFNDDYFPISGGSDDLNVSKDRLYELLGGKIGSEEQRDELGAYDVLMEYEDADIIVPLEVYADEELAVSYHNFADQLAQFCARCFYNSNEVVGVIGVEPIQESTRVGVIDRTQDLSQLQTLFFLQDNDYNVVENNDGRPVDVGKFISIFAHDIVDRSRHIDYPLIANGCVEYAALNSMLAKDNAPTNEVMDVRVPYLYSKRQLNTLAGNRLVTIKEHGGEYKITDSPTCAYPNSGWNRYLTVNIVFDIMDEIRAIYDRYIGGGNTIERRNSLESEIRQALITSPLLKDFNFTMQMSPQDEYMGRLIIPLELVPVTELRKIETVVSIHAQL